MRCERLVLVSCLALTAACGGLFAPTASKSLHAASSPGPLSQTCNANVNGAGNLPESPAKISAGNSSPGPATNGNSGTASNTAPPIPSAPPGFVPTLPSASLAADQSDPIVGTCPFTFATTVNDPTITRQSLTGTTDLLVYLAFTNASGSALSSYSLSWKQNGQVLTRPLLDIDASGSWDTVWLPQPSPTTIRFTLLDGSQKVVCRGDIGLVIGASVVGIAATPLITAKQLQPLSLRGTNYYRQWHPWPGQFEGAMTPQTYDQELNQLQALSINTFRTFLYVAPPNLYLADGTITAAVLGQVDAMLQSAAAHAMKVQLNIGSNLSMTPDADQKRRFRTAVEPFINDGRILMWDLVNEPGGSDGPQSTPTISHWVTTMWTYLLSLDSAHLNTVGLAWQFDQLNALGVSPTVNQYHEYSGAVGVPPPGQPSVRSIYGDLVANAHLVSGPLIIGEFGINSTGTTTTAQGEAAQLALYQDIVAGTNAAVAAGVNVVGIYNWCAFHFGFNDMGSDQQSYGVIRVDGSVKPAGVYLGQVYQGWAASNPAPWDVNNLATLAANDWHLVGAADVNKDGAPDLIEQNFSTGHIRISFLSGTTVSSTMVLRDSPVATTRVETVGDLNGDGVPDLLLHDLLTGNNFVWYLAANGTGTVTGTAVLAATDIDEPHMVGVADFNQDGHNDIVLEDYTTGAVSIAYMNNTNVLNTVVVANANGTASLPWHVEAAADINGDGIPDLFLRDVATGDNQFWIMSAASTYNPTLLTPQSNTNQQVGGLADLNKDGHPDLIWFDGLTLQPSAWLMNGTNQIGSVPIN